MNVINIAPGYLKNHVKEIHTFEDACLLYYQQYLANSLSYACLPLILNNYCYVTSFQSASFQTSIDITEGYFNTPTTAQVLIA